jgi:hypothetical protein
MADPDAIPALLRTDLGRQTEVSTGRQPVRVLVLLTVLCQRYIFTKHIEEEIGYFID